MKTVHLVLFCMLLLTNCSKPVVSSVTKEGVVLFDVKNIQYGTGLDTGGRKVALMLDLYYPKSATSLNNFPLVVMIHGGTFLFGDKADLATECSMLADSGFVVASVNYRLGWKFGFGNCDGDTSSLLRGCYRGLQDINAAIRFLVAGSGAFAIDTKWIFTGGSSAGAILALNTNYITENTAQALLPAEHALLGPLNNSGNSLTETFKISGIANMWGALSDSALINAGNAVPAISFHGTRDNTVPYNIGRNYNCSNYVKLFGSECIQRRLEWFHVPAITNLVIGAGHGPAVYTDEFLMSNTACFFKKIINGSPITSKVYTILENTCN